MRAIKPSDATVINWFVHHPPKDAATVELHESIRKQYRETAEGLLRILPDGPDKTLALRKLQEAMMFANACVANAPVPAEPIITDWRPGQEPHRNDPQD